MQLPAIAIYIAANDGTFPPGHPYFFPFKPITYSELTILFAVTREQAQDLAASITVEEVNPYIGKHL